MSAGFMSVVMPMYLTETLPPDIRGRGTGVFQFCLGFGLVAAAAIGFAVAKLYGAADAPVDIVADAAKSVAWKINFWWTMAPVAVLFVASIRLKESPVWLCRCRDGRKETGRVKELGADRAQTLFQRRYVVPFLLAVAVLTLNKTMGMSSITS